MKNSNHLSFLIAALVCLGYSLAFAQSLSEALLLKSPDKKLTFELSTQSKEKLGESYADWEDGEFPFYRILRDKVAAVDYSPVGLTLNTSDFFNKLSYRKTGKLIQNRDEYTIPHGKVSTVKSRYNQCDFTFTNEHDQEMILRVRVYNDAVAFRYIFPGNPNEERIVLNEKTAFNIGTLGKAWVTPYSEPTKWKPAYELYYTNGTQPGLPGPEAPGFALPALFQVNSGKHWVMLHESDLTGNYPGTHLGNNCANGIYQVAFPHPGEALGLYSTLPRHRGEWEMPWRVIMVSDQLGDILESTVVYDLARQNAIGNTDWIKTGRAAWEWWSTQVRERDFELQKKFIDMASEMGWEYYLVDANWNEMKDGSILQLIEYAKTKNVGLFLWYNSGGNHNHVAEQPRGRIFDPRVRKEEFARLKEWGVKGVKVDFFNSDKQEIINQYLGIFKDAAAENLMVNCHGCTVPRGWTRTYPNLVSMEAVRGLECYGFAPEYPERAAEYNTIAAFTRAVVGPTDSTHVALSNQTYPHLTTYGHEIALPIIYQSGVVHFADKPESYLGLPEQVKGYLRSIPVQFDEIKFIDGYPGEVAVVARRKGNNWYIGAISGLEEARILDISLDFLEKGKHQLLQITDGVKPETFAVSTRCVSFKDKLKLSLKPRGGSVWIINRQDD
jgi:alpha-glucosidase